MTDSEGQTFIIHYKTIDDPGEQTINLETTQQANLNEQQPPPADQTIFNNLEDKLFNHYQSVNEAEKKMINDFLAGDQCLNGVSYSLESFFESFLIISFLRAKAGGSMKFV